MEAAATGKYDSDENDDVEWESQDDEDNEDDDQDNNDATGKSKSGGKKKKIEVAAGELEGLRETAELYKSNIFKLELDELLGEVAVKYDKHKALEKALHHLKAIFDKIPSSQETLLHNFKSEMEKKHNIITPFPHPQPPTDANYKFKFEKPAGVHVVGSYALKSVAKTKGPFTVDLAVEMPASIFQEKDHINYRYFYKRACYLATLANAIHNAKKGFQLEFSTVNDDSRKPVLIVKASGDKSELDFSKTKCVIRIIPCLAAVPFPVQRLAPGRNNVRAKDESETLRPTPQYNASLLADTSYTSNLAFLYQHSKACPAFKDALVLAKIWLHQRGLASVESTHSGFNLFLFAMVMGYLLQSGIGAEGKKLSAVHSSYQLLRGTLDFLAFHDFVNEPVFIGRSDNEEFSQEAFKKHYDVVIVDPSGTVNLAALMSSSGLAQLQHEARLAMNYFNDSVDRFDALFLKNVNDVYLRFDNVFTLPIGEKPIQQYDSMARADCPDYTAFFARSLANLLKQGLTNRVDLIAVQYSGQPAWSLGDEMPMHAVDQKMTVGLVLNPDHAPRLVDQGPDAQDKEAGDKFRKFWGSKSELRRFKDGSILESVVWETQGYENRTLIVQKIITYLLKFHFDIHEAVHYYAGQFYSYLNFSKLLPDTLFSSNLKITGFQTVMNAYGQFAKHLRAVDTALPLLISNVYPASPSLRYTSALLPHPVDTANITAYPTTMRYFDAIDVIVQLERSSKWPDDLVAMQKVKHAFLLKIASELKANQGVSSVVVDDVREKNELAIRGYLDVYYYGYVFRCHIYLEQEGDILKNLINSTKETETKKLLAANALEKYEYQFRRRQMHTFYIQAICARYPAFSATVRLAKRWFGSHLLSSHVSEEFIELICAYVFLESHPWVSCASAFAGFNRVLHLLATWDWKTTPLMVDIEGEMTAKDRDTIMKNFAVHRGQNPKMTMGAMVIATAKDLDGQQWSKYKPSMPIAARIQALAKASCSVLNEAVVSGAEKDFKRIFVTPMQDYSAVIHLKPEHCTRYYQNLHPQSKYLSTTGSKMSELGDKAYAQFDPVSEFVKELELLYGDIMMVFYNKYGGHTIAIVWEPAATLARPWRVISDFNTVPVDMRTTGVLKPAKGATEVSKLAVPNFAAILSEIERLGDGLVDSITTA
ncbi:Nrap protein [Radiomyces spectabilis]|uniref:Nrap protein n=1 Tax=Radiomyces spectabilis TaxID=64574 RepID=UPI0022211605|nr:Nrap protein [Radiomyces spectabilis]KAI8376051.1 Nrap protein [Radiomyces spectabilis]